MTKLEIIKSNELVDYPAALAFMESRVDGIIDNTKNEAIWLLEHPPLYTSGTSAKPADLLTDSFPVYSAGRGGEFTYHGPGQRVMYVMLKLEPRDIRKFVWRLEEVIIQTLAHYGVIGERREGRVGIWVQTKTHLANGTETSTAPLLLGGKTSTAPLLSGGKTSTSPLLSGGVTSTSPLLLGGDGGGKGRTKNGKPFRGNSALVEKAKENRKNPTEPEKKIWQALRAEQLGNYKFRRQEPIGDYIADFVCHEKNLIIEIDGESHTSSIQYDSQRTDEFNSLGYRVIRFWNNEVMENLDGVLESISEVLISIPPPSPPKGRGENNNFPPKEMGGIDEFKIAAIGIRVRKWVGFHGIAINLAPNLDHFKGIVPCGISQYGVTSMEELGVTVDYAEFDAILVKQFREIFEK
jgi:lipoate-protein ligase B/very-short-patch-repair endonuclease